MKSIDIITIDKSKLSFHPLEKSRWKDFEKLFGERGACGGCWCMSWRLKRSEFQKQSGEGNKKAIKKLVNTNETIGILAYYDDEPIGWCAAAPREKYIRLENSKVLKRIDDKPVWSITCFFIDKKFRRQGISTELIKAVIKFCKSKGVKVIEAYPTVPYADNIPAAFAWTGFPSAFEKAGFVEVERRSRTRPMMRYFI
ncbi:MAG: GNAT family N-acetyltransferase [Bacteroidetes bacterium]|nr:GNAT family N-acetyltransferase [Bacteroidota bacterium]